MRSILRPFQSQNQLVLMDRVAIIFKKTYCQIYGLTNWAAPWKTLFWLRKKSSAFVHWQPYVLLLQFIHPLKTTYCLVVTPFSSYIFLLLVKFSVSHLFQLWSPPPVSGYPRKVNVSVTYTYESATTYKGPVYLGKL